MTPLRLWIVEGGKLVEYERTGECNECGDCCEAKHSIRFQVSVSGDDEAEVDESQKDYSEWEGWVWLFAQGMQWWWFIYDDDGDSQQCSAFDTETRKCTIWRDDIKFPAICRYWPIHPKNVERFPRCSFSFRRIEATP